MDLESEESNEYFWRLITQIDLDHDKLIKISTDEVFEIPELNSIKKLIIDKIIQIQHENLKLSNQYKKVCFYIPNNNHRIEIKRDVVFGNKIGKLVVVNNIFSFFILNEIINIIDHKRAFGQFESIEKNTKLQILLELIKQKSALSDPIIDLCIAENNHLDRLTLFGKESSIDPFQFDFLAKIINSSSVKKLNLNLPNIDVVPQNFFTKFFDLKTANLHTPLISSLCENTFCLENLTCLIVSRSNLCSIQNGAFNRLINLKWLVLKGNQLQELRQEMFQDVTKLEYLILNSNLIQKIEPNCFINLKCLKLLDLNGNRISYIDSNTFNGLDNLKILNLNNNRTEMQINNEAFKSCTSLQVLDLADNSIKFLDPNIFDKCNKIKFLTIRNISLQNLDFINKLNELEFIQSFGDKMINLADNLCKIKISSLKFIELVCDQIPLFPKNFQNLQALEISCVNEIENDCFKNLSNLEYLKLHFKSDLAVKKLDQAHFNGINRLKYLKIETGHFNSESIKIFYDKDELFLSLFGPSSSELKHVVDYFSDDFSYVLGTEIQDCESEGYYFKNYLHVSDCVRKAFLDLNSYSSYYKSYVDEIPYYEPNEFF